MDEVRNLLESRLPGLHARIEAALVDGESRYNQRTGQAPSAFLLEHTQRTAAIAHALALRERVDPWLPVLIALFHDAGKFHEGGYHQDEVPEEEHAARLAAALLDEHGMQRGAIDDVTGAVRALYDDRLPCIGPCRVVQDADRLDKLGALGVGAFFTKATLRGRGLVDALAQTLSRELTYAHAAPWSMFTESGRQLALARSERTVAFFDDLLAELEQCGIAAFERHALVLHGDFRTRDGNRVRQLEVTVVTPRTCPQCRGGLDISHCLERGLKCETLKARCTCRACGLARDIAFCLPVLA